MEAARQTRNCSWLTETSIEPSGEKTKPPGALRGALWPLSAPACCREAMFHNVISPVKSETARVRPSGEIAQLVKRIGRGRSGGPNCSCEFTSQRRISLHEE